MSVISKCLLFENYIKPDVTFIESTYFQIDTSTGKCPVVGYFFFFFTKQNGSKI